MNVSLSLMAFWLIFWFHYVYKHPFKFSALRRDYYFSGMDVALRSFVWKEKLLWIRSSYTSITTRFCCILVMALWIFGYIFCESFLGNDDCIALLCVESDIWWWSAFKNRSKYNESRINYCIRMYGDESIMFITTGNSGYIPQWYLFSFRMHFVSFSPSDFEHFLVILGWKHQWRRTQIRTFWYICYHAGHIRTVTLCYWRCKQCEWIPHWIRYVYWTYLPQLIPAWWGCLWIL